MKGTRSGIEKREPRLVAPLIQMTKAQIIRRGADLGVDFSLTHSCYDSDITQAYKLGASSFLVKPTDFHEFTTAIAQMADHWLRGAKIPQAFPFIPPPDQSPEKKLPGISES